MLPVVVNAVGLARESLEIAVETGSPAGLQPRRVVPSRIRWME
jgi:hypothetical protein